MRSCRISSAARIVFVGATTENPSFELNSALLSRCRVHVLEAVSADDIVKALRHALDDAERGLGGRDIRIDDALLRRSPGRRWRRAPRTDPAGNCRGARRRRRGRTDHRGDAAAGAGRPHPPLRQGRRAVLRPDLGAAQIRAQLQPGRRAVLAGADAGRRLRPGLSGAAADPHGDRGHRPGRPARAADGAGSLGHLRALGQPGGRAGVRAAGAVPGQHRQIQCRLRRLQPGQADVATAAPKKCRCTCATRRPS